MKILASAGIKDVFIANDDNPENFIAELIDADAFVIRAPLEKFSGNFIRQCKKLKVIGRTGVGYDMIDVEEAKSLGIPVVITPNANSRSVAEHAVALMFALSKNLIESHNAVINGAWNVRNSGKAFELEAKTVGIIGYGAIGKETAKILQALGMKIISINSGSSRQELEYLLKNADFITLHAPLTEKTRGMISEKEFSMMKPSAFLINTGRGGLIDENSLIDALREKRIAGAGLDVFANEPPKSNSILLKLDNVILTPHSAALTQEALVRSAVMCANGCLAILNGEKWPYVV